MNAAMAVEWPETARIEERDGRFRSRMEDSVKRVDAMLEAWAKWGMGALEHLGLPRETLLARVARCGFTGAAQSGATPEWPQYVVLTERAVLRIQQIERSVIVEHYGHPGDVIAAQARRRGMSSSRFRKILERGRKSVRRELLSLAPTLDLSHTL